MWLGYSVENTIIRNVIENSRTAGVAIDHGRNSLFSGNVFSGNGVAIQLWSDRQDHFPANKYQCIAKPNGTLSQNYTVTGNAFEGEIATSLVNTTEALIYNNRVNGTCKDTTSEVHYSLPKPIPGENIVGGQQLGGNFWKEYPQSNCESGKNFGSVPFKQKEMGSNDAFPLCSKEKK